MKQRNNLQSVHHIDKECIFDINSFKFICPPLFNKNQYVKTSIHYKLTMEQIQIITKIRHQNIVALKKISKCHKNTSQEIFWLYYQTIPYNLEDALHKTKLNINPHSLETSLHNIRNYCLSQKIYPQISKTNIGVSSNGVIKVYLPIEKILKNNYLQISLLDIKIKEIITWYQKLYTRKSMKSKLHKSQQDNQIITCTFNKINKFNYGEHCDKIKYFTKYQIDNNNRHIKKCNSPHKYGLIQHQQPEDHQLEQIKINYRKKKNENPHYHAANKIKVSLQQMITPPKIGQDCDNQSVDTYQMEMGQDFEMPSIRTNQKLRQTLINNKQSWDTLTHKAHPMKSQIDMKIHESAGQKQFMNIINENKRLERQDKIKCSFDSKTVQDKTLGKNWQTSTIKSTLPSNIQNKVEQALAKTKIAMQMLKRAKSTSVLK